MYQLPRILLCLIISLSGACKIDAMDKKPLYPLLDVTGISKTNLHENDYLLSGQKAQTVHGSMVLPPPPPLYTEIYIREDESEKELSETRKLLAQKEQELHELKKKGYLLKALERKRTEENISSNATVASTAFVYYMIAFWLHIGGDPRVSENQGWNESVYPFLNNFGGWLGSQIYGMTQCCCRDDKEQ